MPMPDNPRLHETLQLGAHLLIELGCMYSQAGKQNTASSTFPSLGQADKHVKGSKRTDQQRSENESQADSAGDALHAFADILHEPLLGEHVLSQ